jgi:uncharacterized spore protein YtfJ
MDGELGKSVVSAVQNQEQAGKVVDRLISVAQPGSVFSAPVTAGEYTLITACEVSAAVGMGFGIGVGTGSGPASGEGAGTTQSGEGGGGGGGGGGGSMARPVATISVGPNGVQVQPIVDVTKITIAFFTAFGSMLFMFGRMARRHRRA